MSDTFMAFYNMNNDNFAIDAEGLDRTIALITELSKKVEDDNDRYALYQLLSVTLTKLIEVYRKIVVLHAEAQVQISKCQLDFGQQLRVKAIAEMLELAFNKTFLVL